MTTISGISSHEQTSDALKELFKRHQKLSLEELVHDSSVISFQHGQAISGVHKLSQVEGIPQSQVQKACAYMTESLGRVPFGTHSQADARCYAVTELPGMRVYPHLIPPHIQETLLSSLFHGQLSNPQNKTNVHLHHSLPYDLIQQEKVNTDDDGHASFFRLSPDAKPLFKPLSDKTHRSFSIERFFNSKLRWVTLGAQYDWSHKAYPEGQLPEFPSDIGGLVATLFPSVTPEAAIINLYRPGDVLSMHRDVSEHCDNALVSISLGCDGIFVVGLPSRPDQEQASAVVHLHSGDVVYMDQESRFAWHGLSQVIPKTCPAWLHEWPAKANPSNPPTNEFEEWRSWMVDKRINLSVRQVYQS